MSHTKTTAQPSAATKTAREWMLTLIPYRTSNKTRSWLEFAVTFIPFVLLCTAAYFALNVSFLLSFPLTILAAVFFGETVYYPARLWSWCVFQQQETQ